MLTLKVLAFALVLGVACGDKHPHHHAPPTTHHHAPPKYGPKPEYPPKQPQYVSYYEEVCKLKEWSSDTELCVPELTGACEQKPALVSKNVHPEYPRCTSFKIPKCKATNDAEVVELCTMRANTKNEDLYATLFEAQMRKKCDTHYRTVCQPGYGHKPHCTQVPEQKCYDAPVLASVHVPIKVRKTEVKNDCRNTALPTPKAICWDEDVEVCTQIPQIEQVEENLSICTPQIGKEECELVRLTIPREICFHVQKYRPYYPQYPQYAAKQ